ncbi:GTPase Era [Mycoplasma amphoriforme]|uniref:GTPase Era n=1 Tax=Mycoplasma amphoriforme A39 TaxID=572419 RepID=A0A292IJC7_9MOLU|nr:unnamed protein product [Mycoplasma amphoriforme A39]
MYLINLTIAGCPNVGKSTLLNKLMKKKVAIVSKLPQTTRNATNFYLHHQEFLLKIYDTPGFHKPINKLDLFLNSEVVYSFKQSELVVLVVDCMQDITNELQELINKIKGIKNLKIFLIYSKIDLLQNPNKFSKLKKDLQEILDPFETLELNFLNDDLSVLLDKIVLHFETIKNELENVNEKDLVAHEANNDNFVISEIIREQIMMHTYQEVPHAVAVTIESKKYDEIKNIFHIDANIVVEKDGQKKIIIGKQGCKIKQIGTQTRLELLNLFDCKINLKLFCKVEKNWRNNDFLIKSLGYKKWR